MKVYFLLNHYKTGRKKVKNIQVIYYYLSFGLLLRVDNNKINWIFLKNRYSELLIASFHCSHIIIKQLFFYLIRVTPMQNMLYSITKTIPSSRTVLILVIVGFITLSLLLWLKAFYLLIFIQKCRLLLNFLKTMYTF